MATTSYIWAVRIVLDSAIPDDTTIGCYTVSGANSELRWIENDFALTTSPTTWSAGHLLKNGIDPIKKKIDLRRSGNRCMVDGTTVRIQNTAQVSIWFSTYGIDLHGLTCEIWEITTNGAAETARRVIFTGSCEQPQWTETELTIPVSVNQFKRRANILTTVNNSANGDFPNADAASNGVVVPATFGEIDRAKMVRTARKETVQTNNMIYVLASPAPVPSGITRFPVVLTVSGISKSFRLKISHSFAVGMSGTFSTITDMYLRVVSGAGKDQARYITGASWYSDTEIVVTVAEYFETSLVGSAGATDANNSWCEIVDVQSNYALDVWPCKSLLDVEQQVATNRIDLYSYMAPQSVEIGATGAVVPVDTKDIGFYPLPEFAYEELSSTYHNAVTINAKLFDKSPDQMDAFRVVPFAAASIAPIGDPATDLSGCWNPVHDGTTYDTTQVLQVASVPGFVKHNANTITDAETTLATAPSSFANAVDKDLSTNTRADIQFAIDRSSSFVDEYFYAVECKIPALPTDFDFDTAYLAIQMRQEFIPGGNDQLYESTIQVREKGFYGLDVICGAEEQLLDQSASSAPNPENLVYNVPLEYVGATGDNEVFYVETRTKVSDRQFKLYGYKVFPLDAEKLKSGQTYKIGIFSYFEHYHGSNAGTITTHHAFEYAELGLILKKTVSIKDAIYANAQGRITNDTWGLRINDGALMTTPVLVMEHALRLQNWSETGDNVKWGKAYSPSALIRITGAGSFDDAGLGAAGGTDVSAWLAQDLSVARQITSLPDGQTDAVIQSLCRAAWLAQYQDVDGYECVTPLHRTETPATTIGLTTIIGEVAPFEELDESDVFCAPFVRYNYNYGAEKFDGLMQILNPNDPGTAWAGMTAAQRAAWTPGFTGTGNLTAGRPDGEVIWELCNALWDRTRQIEEPPSDLTDMVWYRDYESALWYFHKWVSWMGKRRTGVSVGYDTGRLLEVCGHVGLQLPHQTNNAVAECIIEGISYSKNGNRVAMDLVVLDDVTMAGSDIQHTDGIDIEEVFGQTRSDT